MLFIAACITYVALVAYFILWAAQYGKYPPTKDKDS